MKNVHVYDIKSEDGQSLMDLIIPVDIGYEWMDVFEKVQGAYLDNVDSYSYTEVQLDRVISSVWSEQGSFKPLVVGSNPT